VGFLDLFDVLPVGIAGSVGGAGVWVWVWVWDGVCEAHWLWERVSGGDLMCWLSLFVVRDEGKVCATPLQAQQQQQQQQRSPCEATHSPALLCSALLNVTFIGMERLFITQRPCRKPSIQQHHHQR